MISVVYHHPFIAHPMRRGIGASGSADFATCRIARFKGANKIWMPIVTRRLGHDVD